MKDTFLLINDLQEVKEFINVFHDEDDVLIKSFVTFAENYIKNYTGLCSEEVMKLKESLKVAVYLIVSELYDNRGQQNLQYKRSLILTSILDMHSINYL